MRRELHMRNFILVLLLVTFIVTSAGYGLGEASQVFFSYQQEQASQLSLPTITANGEFHAIQIRERSSVIMRYNYLRNKSADVVLRGVFSFFCVQTILLVYYHLIHERFVHHERLYVKERFYMILYIKDKDGRKRFS